MRIKYDCVHLRISGRNGSIYCELTDSAPLCSICDRYEPAKLVMVIDEKGLYGKKGDKAPMYITEKQIEEYEKAGLKVEEITENLHGTYILSLMRAIVTNDWPRHERVREAIQWAEIKLKNTLKSQTKSRKPESTPNT